MQINNIGNEKVESTDTTVIKIIRKYNEEHYANDLKT